MSIKLQKDTEKSIAHHKTATSVAAFFSPGGSLAINGGTPSRGRSAIADAAQGFMTAFPDLKVHMDDLLDERGKVIYKWTLEGTNNGPGGTGKRVRISGFEEWRIGDDGRVTALLNAGISSGRPAKIAPLAAICRQRGVSRQHLAELVAHHSLITRAAVARWSFPPVPLASFADRRLT